MEKVAAHNQAVTPADIAEYAWQMARVCRFDDARAELLQIALAALAMRRDGSR